MSKEVNELKKLTREQLIKKKKETEIMLMGSHTGVKPIVPKEKKKNLRRTIARINTLLQENK